MTRAEAIVDQAPDAIILVGRDGAIETWNRAAERLFGWSAAEIRGAGLDAIIPERFRKAHWDGFQRAIDSGHTKYAGRALTTRSVHKDGTRLYVDLTFGLLVEDGVVTGALAIARDCTARHAADTELRARLAELTA
jgi:PAS domain S-box-containing protein